jgi:hypothetical protein
MRKEFPMASKDDHLHVPTQERMKALAKVKMDAQSLQSKGSAAFERGREQSVPLSEAQAVIQRWPDAPKAEAEKLLAHYGPPNEATPTKLFWYRTGPWARMELTADEVSHNFPTEHVDFLTQYVDYPVDPAKADELVAFDGSVIIDRTAGQIAARCDSEAANTLTLNLAVEILEGRRTVDDARRFYAETIAAYTLGRDAPYAERLQFQPPEGTADPDQPMIGNAMLDQTLEKLKDLVGAGERPS